MLFIILMSAGASVVLFTFIPAILLLLLPVRIVSVAKWRRKYVSTMAAWWFHFATYLTLDYSGTKMFIYSSTPEIEGDQGALVISNHRTRVDWMYVGWCYASYMNTANHLLIILKDQLKSVPIFGWATQIMMFVFLSRKRENDIPHIIRTIQYLTAVESKPSVLIFPEGTDLSESNLIKSNTFAKEHNLPETKQVLYPKVTGLHTMVNTLRGRGLALHDITVAYKDAVFGTLHSEGELLRGSAPSEVHLIVRRYEVDKLPSDKVELEKWLRQVFADKEKLLEEWYAHDLKSRTSKSPSTVPASWPPLLNLESNKQQIVYSWMMMMQACVVLLALLVFVRVMRWVGVILVLVCVVSTVMGGFDMMELNWLGPFVCDAVVRSRPTPTSPQDNKDKEETKESNSLTNKSANNKKTD